jgi:hypothetical protein
MYSDGGGNNLRIGYVNGAPHPSPTIEGGYSWVSENPAVFHAGGQIAENGAETDMEPYLISEDGSAVAATVNLANFSPVTFGQTRSTLRGITPIDTVFRRDISPTEKDRFLAYYNTLTGDDLDLVLTYTHGDSPFSEGFSDGYGA